MTEKDKKEIKGYMKKLSDDFGKQIGVYVEDVNDRFKATAEGTAGVNEKLDRIEKTLDSHTEQIANILVDVSSVRLDMNDIRYKTEVTLDRKLDKKHFVDLEGGVRVLEKK